MTVRVGESVYVSRGRPTSSQVSLKVLSGFMYVLFGSQEDCEAENRSMTGFSFRAFVPPLALRR